MHSVLVAHLDSGFGGATAVAVKDALSLVSHGFDVGYISGGGPFDAVLADGGVEVHHFPLRPPGRARSALLALTTLPRATVAIRTALRQRAYDALVVHAYQLGIPATLAIRGLPVPYLAVLHGRLPPKWGLVALGFPNRIAAVSPTIRNSLLGTRHGSRADLIENAVSLPSISNEEVDAFRRQWNLPPSRPIAACVGLLVRGKGQGGLLRAWEEVSRQVAATLVFAGDGPLRPALERQAVELGIAGQVRFVGHINPAVLYAVCDAVVLPSDAGYREGMPLVLIEAGAASRPVVATAVGGTPDIVQDGKTGVLVPPNHPAELASAIVGLLNAPERAREIGEAGHKQYLLRFAEELRTIRLIQWLETWSGKDAGRNSFSSCANGESD